MPTHPPVLVCRVADNVGFHTDVAAYIAGNRRNIGYMGLETAIGESSHLQGSAADVFKEASCDFRITHGCHIVKPGSPEMTESAVL